MHDLVIRGATLYDGGNRPGRTGDLAVAGGRIVELGRVAGRGRREIAADGLALMPGIIDSHTHYDAQITWDPWLDPSPQHGVTTCVIGNCGFTIAPCKPEDRERTLRNLTQVEGMSLAVLQQGIDWSFQTFPEYLARLEAQGQVPNVAAFLGHSSLRTWVLGAAASSRAATPAEVAEMKRVLLEAMRAGAIGFASSTAGQHNGEGGVPMPSRLADEQEFLTLVGALKEAGRGLFMLTKGAKTKVPFLESLAAASGRPVMIAALLHNTTRPNAVFDDLARIGEAQARGHRLYGQVSCCPLTNDFTLQSAYPLESLAAWLPAMQAAVQGREALKAVYRDRSFRDAVREELKEPQPIRLFNAQWDKLELIEAARPEHRAFEHRSVAELARQAGQDPLDWMLDFALSEELESVFTAVLLNADEPAVGRLLRDPNASIALSDAGAHLTFFCDAGFGLHLMGHWSRDLGRIPLAEAIWQLTGRPAEIYGIPGRGRLLPGHAADLLLFDPATVARGRKRRVFDLPGGAPRLTTDPQGVHGVFVNGVEVANAAGRIEDCGRPGRLLREFTA